MFQGVFDIDERVSRELALTRRIIEFKQLEDLSAAAAVGAGSL